MPLKDLTRLDEYGLNVQQAENIAEFISSVFREESRGIVSHILEGNPVGLVGTHTSPELSDLFADLEKGEEVTSRTGFSEKRRREDSGSGEWKVISKKWKGKGREEVMVSGLGCQKLHC